MYRLVCLLLGLHLVLGCDSDLHRPQDAGPDADASDATDVMDVQDISDVQDVTDTTDASGFPDGWPAPSCDEDPYQIAVAATDANNYTAFYPYLYIPQRDYQIKRTELFSFNVETQESRVLFTLEPETITMMVLDPESQTLWISVMEPWNYENPDDRAPPRILRWNLVTETLDDLTPQMPQLRTDECEAYNGNLLIQMLDLERNRILFHCGYTIETKINNDLYFVELTTGEKSFLGHHEDKYYARGFPYPETYNSTYYDTYCARWSGNTYFREWNSCYWKVDVQEPVLVYESSDGDRINSSTSQVSSDNQVYQVWQTENGYELTATDLLSGEVEFLPALPVYPQSFSSAGKLFPRLLAWVEGYDPGALNNWLQANIMGHAFLMDRDAQFYRQVTCLEGVGSYGPGMKFLPGDPTGRYGLIVSTLSNTSVIHVKDLRAAGIMSEDGQLLPPPAK